MIPQPLGSSLSQPPETIPILSAIAICATVQFLDIVELHSAQLNGCLSSRQSDLNIVESPQRAGNLKCLIL